MGAVEFIEKIKKNKISIKKHLFLTWRCNLRCRHCYNYLPQKRDLPAGEIRNELDRFAKEGCLFLCLSGGEPLLRKDFLSIANYAVSRSFAVILDTNGTLITPALADKIKQLNFSLVRVTLLGAKADTHERITGVKGSFEKTLNAIRLLKEKGINTVLQTTTMRENNSELEDVKALAGKVGVNYKFSSFRPFSKKSIGA
jgi:MoaA/NifB/PqqE/SkfB family radical SAM enzyme